MPAGAASAGPVGRDPALAAEVAGLARVILADPMCRSGDDRGREGRRGIRAPVVHLAHRIAEVEVDGGCGAGATPRLRAPSPIMPDMAIS
jgi:hypothetical protein